MEFEYFKLIYIIDKNKSPLRLLGEEFYKDNKQNGFFIYKNKKHQLQEKFDVSNVKAKELKIIIIFYKMITDKSYMFKDCVSLLKLFQVKPQKKFVCPEILFFNEKEDHSSLLYSYSEKTLSDNPLNESFDEIDSFPDDSIIKKKQLIYSNISTVLNIYKNIKVFPNIQSFPKYLAGMFYNCSSLISLPDISEWNTKNVTYMNLMFYNCS